MANDCNELFEKNVNLEKMLLEENNKLKETIKNLETIKGKIIEEDKLASIGQLSAGIAHEINNPLGFVLSNFETLKKYMYKFRVTLLAYRDFKNSVLNSTAKECLERSELIKNLEDDKSLDFIMEDLDELFNDTEDGLERVRKIVMALRSFARQDQEGTFEEYDVNSGMETALLIAKNEVKYNSEIEKDFGEIPLIEANSGQINQVFLNVIINASHAIKEKAMDKMGLIKIKTYCDKEYVYCLIEDNGMGISEENLSNVFNPFFTTKPLGVGTGLGLSISYDIIKNKHKGDIKIESKKNQYTIIEIKLPITQQRG
ncbi:sensor histidine kinase [Clostridium thailandense]|uniref:sensor histidine kinase n=1 Tax=Clostridium thailandense TaxID=2794346 RepID=UPI003989E6AB